MTISKELSNSFQAANLIATVLVISIHYNSKMHISIIDVNNWNFLIQEFFTNSLARIAVPFFALSAGIFFFLKYENISSFKANLHKRIHSILIPYLLACTIIFVANYLHFTVLKDVPYDLTTYNVFHDIVLHPQSVQFWFLRDLMFLVLFSPIILLSIEKFGYFLVFFLTLFWLTNTEVTAVLAARPFITIETLLFFSLGCLLVKKDFDLGVVFPAKKVTIEILAGVIFIGFLIIRIAIDPMPNYETMAFLMSTSLLLYKSAIVVGVYFIIIFSYRLTSTKLVYLSSFTYFAFLYHLSPLSKFVTKTTSLFVEDQYQFYLNFPVATVLVFMLAILLNKKLKTGYDILTGARSPEKVLKRYVS